MANTWDPASNPIPCVGRDTHRRTTLSFALRGELTQGTQVFSDNSWRVRQLWGRKGPRFCTH